MSEDRSEEEYEALWLCFLSEQMDAAELSRRMDEDPLFRAYTEKRRAERSALDGF